jgi:hypothetical protein
VAANLMSVRTRVWPISIVLLSFCAILPAAERRTISPIPPPEILGVSLGMPYAQARTVLAKLGQMQKEEEGQQVWRLLGNEHYQFLIVGFDGERRVRYVTALADASGTPLNYQDVGDIVNATRTGQPGNLTFTWKGTDRKPKFEYLAIAKGKDAQRLSSFTVKRMGVRAEEDD